MGTACRKLADHLRVKTSGSDNEKSHIIQIINIQHLRDIKTLIGISVVHRLFMLSQSVVS